MRDSKKDFQVCGICEWSSEENVVRQDGRRSSISKRRCTGLLFFLSVKIFCPGMDSFFIGRKNMGKRISEKMAADFQKREPIYDPMVV